MSAGRNDFVCLPSQTVGPFFHLGLAADPSLGCLVRSETKGERLRLRVRLFDGDGAPVPDGLIELWQADSSGKYRHPADAQEQEADPAFWGFGRLATDANGVCVFETIRPGRVSDGRGGCQAAHINLSVFARGLLARLCTRVYFEGDSSLPNDSILALVPESRRATLLARPDAVEPGAWNFDIHLQGEHETAFFDF